MNNCRTNSRTNTTTRTPPHINRHRPNQSPSATQQQQHQLSVLSSHNFDRRPPTPSQCPPLTECVWGTPKPLSTRGCCHRQVKSGKLLGTAAIIASWQPRPSRNIYLLAVNWRTSWVSAVLKVRYFSLKGQRECCSRISEIWANKRGVVSW